MPELTSPRCALACTVLSALVALPACGSTPAPYRVRYVDVANGAAAHYDGKRALVVELDAGEHIPVNLQFDGEDLALVPERPALELVAKHHCYVRLWNDGVRASLDGVHFDEKPRVPGHFRIGLTANRAEPTRLDVIVVTPRR